MKLKKFKISADPPIRLKKIAVEEPRSRPSHGDTVKALLRPALLIAKLDPVLSRELDGLDSDRKLELLVAVFGGAPSKSSNAIARAKDRLEALHVIWEAFQGDGPNRVSYDEFVANVLAERQNGEWRMRANIFSMLTGGANRPAGAEPLLKALERMTAEQSKRLEALMSKHAAALDAFLLEELGHGAEAAGGESDDLTQIKGIGAKRARLLNDHGIHRFAQIAAWTKADIDRLDKALELGGRVKRDGWVAQARKLAEDG